MSVAAGSFLNPGDKAPDVTAPLSDGTTFHLNEWLDKGPIVLYFYPKDDTPGCTAEACGFRDDFTAFRRLNATIIGVSYDDLESHKKFISKYNLPFPLASDTDHSVAQAYGVAGYGKAERATFVIGKDGKIIYVNRKVDPHNHSQEIQEVIGQFLLN